MEDMCCTLSGFLCSRLKPDRLFGVPVSTRNEIIVVPALYSDDFGTENAMAYIMRGNIIGTDARKQFDRTAASYAVSRAHSNSRSLVLLKEFAGDRRYRIAIDIATGPGFAAFALADQCDEMIATDISEGMLQQGINLLGNNMSMTI